IGSGPALRYAARLPSSTDRHGRPERLPPSWLLTPRSLLLPQNLLPHLVQHRSHRLGGGRVDQGAGSFHVAAATEVAVDPVHVGIPVGPEGGLRRAARGLPGEDGDAGAIDVAGVIDQPLVVITG